MSGHSPWWQIRHKAPDAERARLLAAGGLSEAELAAALVHTYGMGPGHAAELAASHFGHPHRCLPDSAYPTPTDGLVKDRPDL